MRSKTGRSALHVAAVLGLLALAACSSKELPCPAAQVLRDASQLVKFAPGQPASPENVLYAGQIDDAKLNCSYDPKSQDRLEVSLGVKLEAQRPPNSTVEAADLNYFVAIVNLQGELIARKDFPLRLPFKPGTTTVGKVEDIFQMIPLKYPQNGGSLQIWVGFLLSDAELQYNRAHATVQ